MRGLTCRSYLYLVHCGHDREVAPRRPAFRVRWCPWTDRVRADLASVADANRRRPMRAHPTAANVRCREAPAPGRVAVPFQRPAVRAVLSGHATRLRAHIRAC